MSPYTSEHLKSLVQDTRIHRDVYIDKAIFDLEMERIWGQAWIYVGHESQVSQPGDFYTTRLGAENVVMVRDKSGALNVIYNRCGHKGAKVVARRCGSAKGFRCPYHGWTFKLDGGLRGVPAAAGYKETGFDKDDPCYSMQKVAQVESYRGFVFASLSKDMVPLSEFLGDVAATLDNIADRAPDGEVEVVGGPLRYVHDCNWKMFIENLNDAMHPMVAHASVGDSARRYVADMPEGTEYPPKRRLFFRSAAPMIFLIKWG